MTKVSLQMCDYGALRFHIYRILPSCFHVSQADLGTRGLVLGIRKKPQFGACTLSVLLYHRLLPLSEVFVGRRLVWPTWR